MKAKKIKTENKLAGQDIPDIQGLQNFRVWLDEGGTLCIGNECFHIKSNNGRVIVTLNESCPIVVEKPLERQKLDRPEEQAGQV